ncbi:RICIN domain-containing protein [Fibrobacter sp. UWB12]|uniref:RICIN domain-containing protein n=1 Tax=Fibrobacter sp. UWB12 TaxID=1896203 RepID=UPI00091C11A4|nr:RICIN domain-containing protein [Fibrobacter sp. UWB12]SHK67759.1 hypothetical protein SAMN05720759_10579 [Fibrobacter sp. UWB12]
MDIFQKKTSFIGIFSFLLPLSSAFAGNVEYHLNKSANPTQDEREAYALIEAAMDSAVYLYNKYSDLSKHIEVYYSTGVPTAEASSNGDLRFGKDRNYMYVGTAMHEMAHTMGMGTTSEYQSMMSGGVFKGEKAQKVIKEIDGPDAVLKGDSQHFWPYGLNYRSEVHSEQDLINHVKIVNAMYQDIFKEAFYMQGRVVSLVDEKTCMGITSSNALELMSCADTATFVKIYSVGENPVTYRIQLGNRVVDIPNESTAAGVVASTYGYNGGAHQRYVFEKAGAPRANMSNVFFLKNFKSGLYLQAVGKNVVQNKFVRSASSIPQSDFIWQIVEAGQDSSSKDGPVSIAKRRIPNKISDVSVPSRLFDALGRAAGQIRRGVTSRILKSN